MDAAQIAKAPVQQLADKICAIFVPAIFGIAALTFVGWLMAGRSPIAAMVAAIAVIVIACPCALGLATPAAIMVGSGRGAQQGILLKGGESLQRVREVNTVVLDKTGTVTQGTPKLTDLLPAQWLVGKRPADARRNGGEGLRAPPRAGYRHACRDARPRS